MFKTTTKDGYTLCFKETGEPVEQGRICPTSDGDLYRITGGDPKVHNPASQGSVWCYEVDEDGESDWQREYYPSVFNLVWVKD